MKWYLYKKDDPSTYPHINCPMLLVNKHGLWAATYIWDNIKHCFHNRFTEDNHPDITECYYAYVGYIPGEYKTLYPTKCMYKNDGRCAYEDDGYCMDYDNEYACGCKKEIAEYEIEMKEIWKEFEHDEY